MPYSGSLLGSVFRTFNFLSGFFVFSFIADNYGRKFGLGTAWLSATIGTLLLGVITQIFNNLFFFTQTA